MVPMGAVYVQAATLVVYTIALEGPWVAVLVLLTCGLLGVIVLAYPYHALILFILLPIMTLVAHVNVLKVPEGQLFMPEVKLLVVSLVRVTLGMMEVTKHAH